MRRRKFIGMAAAPLVAAAAVIPVGGTIIHTIDPSGSTPDAIAMTLDEFIMRYVNPAYRKIADQFDQEYTLYSQGEFFKEKNTSVSTHSRRKI